MESFWSVDHPSGGFECASDIWLTALRPVYDLQTLAHATEEDDMVADYIAGANCVYTDLPRRTLTYNPLSAIYSIFT